MKYTRKMLVALTLASSAFTATASGFPERPVSWVVPWAPGGASDTVGRMISDPLAGALKQSVIVENKPGAGGNIGTEMVARAAPDGYTLIQLTDSTTISPSLYASLNYEPNKSFAPITLIGTGPHVLVAGTDSPIKTLPDLLKRAQQNPGSINYATAGVGSAQHLAIEMFSRVANIQMTHVPYKGGAPAMIDVLSGQVPVGVFGLAPVLPHIKSGKLRAIAVTSPNRSNVLPDVPTVAESGFPSFSSVQWFGVAAPAGTPSPVISKLNRDIVAAIQTPKVVKGMKALGLEIVASTPEQFTSFISEDSQRWSKVIKDLNISLN